MEDIKDFRQKRNEDYWKFIACHKITNVQSVDTVAKYFCENIDSVDFSDPNNVYAALIDNVFIKKEETALENVKMLVEGSLKANNSSANYEVSERSSFVDISSPIQTRNKKYSECKLWLNVKHEYYPIFTQEIMNYLAQTSDTDPTDFKICTTADRNDYISIYTDYANAGSIIDMLKTLKVKNPNLFEPRVKDNPLIAKVDDVVSYADVGHCVSYPATIAKILNRINLRRGEILRVPAELRVLKTKKTLLEIMMEDANELRSSPEAGKTYLICPTNLSSIRSSQGIPYKDLTEKEIEKEIQIIQSQIEQIVAQAKKISDNLKQEEFTV